MPKLVRKAETCEACGRDLPVSEICQYCGHDNHQVVLGGWACKRIRNEIEREKLEERIAELETENEKLKGQIGDLRAAAVRKGLMKGGCFTGKH